MFIKHESVFSTIVDKVYSIISYNYHNAYDFTIQLVQIKKKLASTSPAGADGAASCWEFW